MIAVIRRIFSVIFLIAGNILIVSIFAFLSLAAARAEMLSGAKNTHLFTVILIMALFSAVTIFIGLALWGLKHWQKVLGIAFIVGPSLAFFSALNIFLVMHSSIWKTTRLGQFPSEVTNLIWGYLLYGIIFLLFGIILALRKRFNHIT